MLLNIESLASDLLELASEHRLEILQMISQNSQTLSEINKKSNRTASETHRNLQRLLDSQLISKNSEGKYSLTTFGKTMMFQLDSVEFLIAHKDFWNIHSSNIPEEFLRRLGDLANSEMVSGFVRVQELWRKIYQNSENYIYNMLQEASYDLDTISSLKNKLEQGISLHSLFSEDSVFSEKRDSVKSSFSDFVKNGKLERRMCKSFPAVVFLNEKEGCVCFSDSHGRVDLGKSFYGNSKSFQKWCLDFFNYFWLQSSRFSEEKLQK